MKTSDKITDDFIASLLSQGSKGQYRTCLDEFANSDEAVVNPREAWPLLFADKTATAMYQSFNNAKAKLNGAGEDIKILQRDGEVFLMHTGRVKLRLEASTDADATDEIEVTPDNDIEGDE